MADDLTSYDANDPPYVMTPQAIIYVTPDLRTHTISPSHVNYLAIREKIKERDFSAIPALIDAAKAVVDATEGEVEVRGGVVYYQGEVVHGTITQRILDALREGFDARSQLHFLDKLGNNPSYRAVTELYDFIEAAKISVRSDGKIVAYKRVRSDYKDLYTGKIDNSVGKTVSMRRNKVDEDKYRTCSYGLHFCSQTYLPHYGAGDHVNNTNRIIVVEIDPADVVAIPADHNNAKGRTCRYKVIGEFAEAERRDILAERPVWTDEDVEEHLGPGGATVEDEEEVEAGEGDYAAGKEQGAIDGETQGELDADDLVTRDPDRHLGHLTPEAEAGEDDYERGYRDGYRTAYYKAYARQPAAGASGADTSATSAADEAAMNDLAEPAAVADAAPSVEQPGPPTTPAPPEPPLRQPVFYTKEVATGTFKELHGEPTEGTVLYIRDDENGRFMEYHPTTT